MGGFFGLGCESSKKSHFSIPAASYDETVRRRTRPEEPSTMVKLRPGIGAVVKAKAKSKTKVSTATATATAAKEAKAKKEAAEKAAKKKKKKQPAT